MLCGRRGYGHCFSLVGLLFLIGICSCLFEDQAFKFDWIRRNVGVPEKLVLLSDHPETVVVGTASSVIASLGVKTGAIVWRHQLPESILDVTSFPERSGSDSDSGRLDKVASISGSREELYFRIWANDNGALISERYITKSGEDDDGIAAFDAAFVHGSTAFVLAKNRKQGLKVHVYDFADGSLLKSFSLSAGTSSNLDLSKCAKTKSTYACLSSEINSIIYFNLDNDHSSAVSLNVGPLSDLGLVQSPEDEGTLEPLVGSDAVFFRSVSRVVMFSFSDGKLISSNAVLDADFLLGCYGGQKIYAIKQEEDDIQVQTLDARRPDGKTSSKFTLKPRGSRGRIAIGAFYSCAGSSDGKTVMVFEDGSIGSFAGGQAPIWIREESLAEIEAVEIVDRGSSSVLDVRETDALYGEHIRRDVLEQFFKRLKAHGNQLYFLMIKFGSARNLGLLLNQVEEDHEDDFGIRKIVVVATKRGTVYGIDSKTGEIIWRNLMVPGGEKMSFPVVKDKALGVGSVRFFLQRTAHHYGMDPLCTMIFNRRDGINLISFDPLDGKVLSSKMLQAATVTHAFLLHQANGDNVRPLVILDENDRVMLEPADSDLVPLSGKIFVATVVGRGTDKEKIIGRRLTLSDVSAGVAGLKMTTVWTLTSPDAKILTVLGKPSDQVVHSQGRVMADRSVLFKYINPNLGFVLAEGKDALQKRFINIYLVDLVTGRIVYSATHKRVTGPYHVVHAENWAVYTYYNEKSRRAELASLELFEGTSQSNTTVFSSLTNTVSPLVERQSFILGPSFVSALVDTKTEKAITSKHLLMATSVGSIYDVPRHLLDPRRPNMNTPPEQREPGLPPYIPELQLPTEFILNYNQSVISVRGMTTAPTGLESTSVLFVHGLDLYGSTVTPSKGFDLLKDDFDYYVISSVLLALIAAAFITKRLSQGKNLKQAWR